MYYSKGIVNPGESYIYLDELGQWADFADVVTYLKDSDDFSGFDFDNFPVKAYLDYAEGSDAAQSAPEELKYADPAGIIKWSAVIRIIVRLLIVIAIIVLVIVAIVKLSRRNKEFKRLQARVKELEAQLPQEPTTAEEKTEEKQE